MPYIRCKLCGGDIMIPYGEHHPDEMQLALCDSCFRIERKKTHKDAMS